MTPWIVSLAWLSTGEMIVVLIIVLLLFGSTKIPALMRSMGKGIGEFKKGVNEGNLPDPASPAATPPPPPPANQTKP